jgi:translation initiation factor 2D
VGSITPVDIKHSTFKTLTHFLKASAQEGLIKNKEQKGDVVITHVYPNHPAISAHIPLHTMRAAAREADARKEREQTEAAKLPEIVVTELWKGVGDKRSHLHFQSFFQTVNREYVLPVLPISL